MQDYSDILGSDGALAAAIDGFSAREPQQAMAQAVAQAIEQADTLVCEAGTGTGKTFAYLTPALLSGKRVIISTGTKHLQDQLFHRDLPVLRRALGSPAKVSLLKGRANYLCLHRLALAEQEDSFFGPRQVREFKAVQQFRQVTHSGDLGELAALAEDSALRPQITSTVDNCLGSECPEYSNCFVLKARRNAQAADIVVINHHLLLADMVLKQEGFGELLPGADAVVVDEAHQLPDLVGQYFGDVFSSRQALDLVRDTRNELMQQGSHDNELQRQVDKLETAARDARLSLGISAGRRSWEEIDTPDLTDAVTTLRVALDDLAEQLAPLADNERGIESCQRRSLLLSQRLALFADENETGFVRWCEIYKHSFVFNRTPVEAAEQFRKRLEAERCAWIFTSATLAVGEKTTHFTQRLGVDDPGELVLGSPFNYNSNALLYIPKALPLVNDRGYNQAVVEAAIPMIEESQGRAFLLFTSHRALSQAAEQLRDRLDLPLLIQNEAPRAILLERFRRLGNAVLLGTASFWEGVDVKGSALSLVVIDKLPFASPGDPVLAARLKAIETAGGNPFMQYQVPQAVLTLKQGVGRLIRDANDTGVLMLCDPRLVTKPYGRIFLASLPAMPQTRELEEAQEFLRTRTYLDATG